MRANPSSIDVSGGFYTVAEAARLLGLERSQRILRWLHPTRNGAPAVVQRDYQKLGRQHEVSFLDLIEIKFVEHFRRVPISLQALRIAAQNAREELNVSHPFATGNVKFQTDRKQVFLETARLTGDRELLNLMTKQVGMYDVIEQSFASDLEFSVDGLAKAWRPSPNTAPNVLVSPAFAFGQPVISDRRVPTVALFEYWKANGQRADDAGKWFKVPPAHVEEAVRFELRPLH